MRMRNFAELFIERLALEADEGTDARVRLAEHVAARGDFAADEHLSPRPAVACIDLLRGFVIAARVVLVVEQPVGRLDRAAEDLLDVHARERAQCADAVAERPPVATPMPEHVALV